MAIDPLTCCVLCTCLLTCWPCVVPFGIVPIPYPCYVLNVGDRREDQETWKQRGSVCTKYMFSDWRKSFMSAPLSSSPTTAPETTSSHRMTELSKGDYSSSRSKGRGTNDVISVGYLDVGAISRSNLLEEYSSSSESEANSINSTTTSFNLFREFKDALCEKKASSNIDGDCKVEKNRRHSREASRNVEEKKRKTAKEVNEEISRYTFKTISERKERKGIENPAYTVYPSIKSLQLQTVKNDPSAETLVNRNCRKKIENFDLTVIPDKTEMYLALTSKGLVLNKKANFVNFV